MVTGIYKLNFPNTSKVYIGQSKCIERRFTIHLRNMLLGKSPKKLQEAYTLYGKPTYEILCESSIETIDSDELDAINIFDSVNNGFNTLAHQAGKNTNIGQEANTSQYTNDQYIEVFELLIDNNLFRREIAQITNVSIDVVKSIANLECHKWLKEVYPDKYCILENLNKVFNKYDNGAIRDTLGSLYILSPDNKLMEVVSIRGFARIHNLIPQCLGKVLRGESKHHKGWTLPDSTNIKYYPILLNPDDQEIKIEYGKASEFAKINNLCPSKLSQLLNKKIDSYKEWKRK